MLAKIYNDLCPVKTPPQEENPRVRQTIDGHPIVIFWDNGTDGVKFIGKYNFNHDKGTEEVFGFTAGDESWEIRQNGTELTGFRSADFSGDAWKSDFEARYPEDNVDITNLKAFAEWLVSTNAEAATNETLSTPVTYNGVEYTTDSAEYRLAKFKMELANHANVDALVFYYVITELFLCIDQREKNAFPTLWKDNALWMMLFYDADSSLGIDNKGNLAFDYYLEDIDYTEAGDPVFNGQASVLWVNLRKCFYDNIMAEYKRLRTTVRSDGSGEPLLSYDVVNNLFESHQGKWSEAIYNEDGYRKSIEPYVLNGDTMYLPMLQGKKEQQRKWWLYNRFRYLDSKYNTGTSMTNRIIIRAHAQSNIKLMPYVNMYGHVYYNSEMAEHRMNRDQEYEFEWAASGAEDAVIGINDADMLTSLGDLSPLMVETIDISKATHLTALKVGDASEDYANDNLNSITLGNNVLLRTIDMRNCTALSQAVDASGCTGLEEVYFDGTAITGLTLPNGGGVRVLHLPETITNLTIRNQPSLTELVVPSYANISTLRIENNGSAVDPFTILDEMAPGSRVRIIGFDVEVDTAEEIVGMVELLNSMRGLDESGNNTDSAQVVGRLYVPEIEVPHLEIINAAKAQYPSLTIEYGSIRTYTVSFYNGDTLLETVENVTYGSDVVYSGETPVKSDAEVPEDWRFVGWSEDVMFVASDLVCQAEFGYANVDSVKLVEGTLSGEYENDDVENIGACAFIGTALTAVSLPAALSVGEQAFYGNRALADVDIPLATTLGGGAFRECTALTSVSFPGVTELGKGVFAHCTSLVSAKFTDVFWGESAFNSCTALVILDFNYISGYGVTPYWGLRNLQALVLRDAERVSRFAGFQVAVNTGNDTITPYIYVPSVMVDTYKAATGWCNHAERIRALEDYTVDGTITGELDETKISA